jgi:multidrug efflux system membrane fusion protein
VLLLAVVLAGLGGWGIARWGGSIPTAGRSGDGAPGSAERRPVVGKAGDGKGAEGKGAEGKGAEGKGAEGRGKGAGRFDPANRTTPVTVATIARGELEVILNALGTVTPLRTVTVRSRVDGEIIRLHFREGQMVREGDLLAEIDPRPFQVQVTQMEGQKARDEALLANARIDLERYRTLAAQDSIASQQVDTQAALVRQLEGTVRMDAGQLDNARLQLSYARITAPISGRIGLRQLDQGNVVRASDAAGLVVITQTAPVSVIYTLPQDSLPAVLRRSAAARLATEAWDREQKVRLATGQLASIDNQIDVSTGTVKLRAQFDNRDEGLFPNQFVNVRMRVETLRDVVLVPASAVQRGVQGLFVYLARDDGTVTVRAVRTGVSEAGRTQVIEGLAPGDRVVVDGVDRLREGAKIEIADPAARAGGGPGRPGGERGNSDRAGRGGTGPDGQRRSQ